MYYNLLFQAKASSLTEDDKHNKANPPYYNIKEPGAQNIRIMKDGALVSSEGYSYVTEVPSLPHQRHSSSSTKKSDYYQQPADDQSEHGYENSRMRRTHRKITHNEKRYHSGIYHYV